MSLMQFLRIFWARRWIILVAASACLLAGVLAVLVLPKRYVAESRIMLNVVGADPVTGEVIASNFARAYVPTQTELIRDYRVSGRVVDRLGWTKSPDLRAAYKASGERTVDFRRWLAQGVSASTQANAIEGSNIVIIGYEADNPEVAAQMADAVRDAYVDESLSFKRGSAEGSAEWFRQQATKLRADLAAAEGRKAEFERANNIVLLDDGTDADTARLQSLAGSVDTPRLTGGGGGGGGGGDGGALAQIDAKIATESQSLGPNHPVIQDLRRQRAAIAAAPRGGGAPSAPVYSGPSIASQVAGARSRVLAQRGKVEEARRLFTDVKVLQDQYGKIAARMNDFNQQAASNESGVTLLDSAIPPSTPSSPKIPQILIASLALGLVVGLLVGLIAELLNRRVRGSEDLESLNVPLIGIITAKALPALPA